VLGPEELAERAKNFPSRWVLQHLAAASSRPCFDGTSFLADSPVIATGDNILSAITGSGNSDGLTSKLFALHVGGALKPVPFPEMTISLGFEAGGGMASSQPVGKPHHGRPPARLVALLRL
jgi:hypothetical protein